MFTWKTGVCPLINYNYASIFYLGFCQGVLEEVTWVTWWAFGYNAWYHWGKLQWSWIGKSIVEIYKKHEDIPEYKYNYHSKHLVEKSIDFLTIGVKCWSLVCPPIDAYERNWYWTNVWILTYTYHNKILTIRFVFSYNYGINSQCRNN